MANVKVSAETAAGTLDGTEQLRIVQSGASVRTTVQLIADFANNIVRNGVAAAFDTFAEVATSLATKVATTRTITSGAGLTGGGDLSADRTLAVGAGAGIVANADDIAVDAADAAALRAGTANKVLTADGVLSALAAVALTPGANISLDLATGVNFSVTLGANSTLDNPTNHKVGRTIYVQVTQDGTGSRTLSYGSQYDFGQDSAPVLSTGAGVVDTLAFFVRTTTKVVWLGHRKDV